MQLQTILNHVQKHKSFVYDDARFVQIKGKASLGA